MVALPSPEEMETNAEEMEEEVVVEVVGKGTAELGTPSTLEAQQEESSSEDSDDDSVQLVQEVKAEQKTAASVEELGQLTSQLICMIQYFEQCAYRRL